ncbi:ATP-binding protein [Geobacillus sp. WSUCF-018B]|uniref:ATP-binding protein n=1 Tax=Geobacillus sp. WSUCF-018B TaxID=2055939 RepID=UPI00130411F3|nr:ATP-binding protein [Geobacillus sp. WSUCF-018B]
MCVFNQNCVAGWLYDPAARAFTGKCQCAMEYQVFQIFKLSGADEKNILDFENMKDIKIYNRKKGLDEYILYKDLLKQMESNLKELINPKAPSRIFLVGEPGCGKTAFATTLIYLAARKEIKSYFLPTSSFEKAVFHFNDKTALDQIFEEIKNKQILVIDDFAAELSSDSPIYIEKISKAYNDLIRAFEGLVIVTTNNTTEDNKEKYQEDPRLFSVLYKAENLKEYIFEPVDLRQEEKNPALDRLF